MSASDNNEILKATGNVSGDESAGEMIWPAPKFDKTLKTNFQLLRKKRVHSSSFSHSGTNGLTIDGVPSDLHTVSAAMHHVHLSENRLPFGKNSRKSRDGRKMHKKRGGKVKDGSRDELDEIELDPCDPDYDSDVNVPVTFDEFQPVLSEEGFDELFTSLLREYFEHGKTREVIDALVDANLTFSQRRRVVYLAIVLAIQHKQTQCELTSELFSDMFGRILNPTHIQQGFQLILSDLEDLSIDAPKIHEYVGRFIARAVNDEILPANFVEIQKFTFAPTRTEASTRSDSLPNNLQREKRLGSRNLSDSSNGEMIVDTSSSSGVGSFSSLGMPTIVSSELALKALSKAENILTQRHIFVRLNDIWGLPAGPRTTKLLVEKIDRLLESYINSNDIIEAIEVISELDAPHFHHELVYQAVIKLIELSTQVACDRVVRLLNDLYRSAVLTPDQLKLGISRVYSKLSDLKLDVPNAYGLMERFMRSTIAIGFMPKHFAQSIALKQRKRFISETDSLYRSPKPW